MARSSWWNKPVIIKDDFDDPIKINTTKGEVWTIYEGLITLFIFMMIVPLLSLSNNSFNIIIKLALPFFAFICGSYMYTRFAILPHKDDKRYVASCTTLLISAWISLICVGLYACGIHWEEYSFANAICTLVLNSVCAIVNLVIASLHMNKLNKQAQQEGKSLNIFPLLIHVAWVLMPLVVQFVGFRILKY